MHRYQAAILFVGGFGQRRRACNGVWQAFDATYRRAARGDVLISYVPWLASPSDVAGSLAAIEAETRSQSQCLQRLQIALVGYSFGGCTANAIARGLYERNVCVQRLVLCDPVARWLGRLGWTRSMFPASIRVPGNVKHCAWLRQTNPRFRPRPPFFFPSSHRVVADSNDTRLVSHTLGVEHIHVDDSLLFHSEVAHAVNHVLKRVPKW